jgi:hypothetical protein
MALIRRWRNFKQMHDLVAVAAGLIFASGALRAFERGADEPLALAEATLVWPAVNLAAALALPLRIQFLRRLLARYVWMSFVAGFGQTVVSVIVGAGLMIGAAMIIHREVATATDALSMAPIFCAYASGIGILAAQALLARALERRPEVRALIEKP